MAEGSKFCKFCGSEVNADAVICTKCGKQIEELKTEKTNSPQVIINNSNQLNNSIVPGLKKCDKWVSLILCIFLGFVGGHKFYEGKIGLGLLYLFTFGLFGIGVVIDLITILTKPNPYYV